MKSFLQNFKIVNILAIFLFFNFQLLATDIFDITCSGNDIINVSCGNALSGQLFVDGQGVFDDVIYYNCDCQHPAPSGCPSPGSESQKLYLEKVFKISPTGNLLTVSVNNHSRMVVYFTSCSGNGFCDQISSTINQDRRIYELDLSNSSFSAPIYMVIDGFNTQSEFNSPINYDIEFTCSNTPDPEFSCENAMTLECNKEVNSSNVGSPNNTNSYGCVTGTNSNNFTGGEKIFKFTPTETADYQFSLSKFSGDLDLFLLSSCSPENCLTNEGATAGAIEIINMNLNAGNTYYLVVDGFASTSSSFTLGVTCPQKPDPCAEAFLITCGNSYLNNTTSETNKFNQENYPCYTSFSTFNGKDKIFRFNKTSDEAHISITLYHNSNSSNNLALFLFNGCPDETNCIGSKGTDIFSGSSRIGEYWTDAGSPLPKGEYFIVVDGPSPSIFSPFKITLNCEGPACTEVEKIQLGETKNGESNVSGSNRVSAYECNESLFGYTGKERLYEFSLTDQKTVSIELNGMNTTNFDLFLLDDCSTNSCLYYSNQPAGVSEKIGPVILSTGTYYILVDVKNTSALTNKETEGNFNLTLQEKKKSSDDCTACEGVVDPDWYSDLIEKYANCCLQYDELNVTVEIYQCTYRGQTVIHIPPTSCNDSQGLVYDCSGNLILSYPPTDTLVLQNCTLIWACDGDQAGCDFVEKDCSLKNLVCGGNADTTWLVNLQNALTSCCSETPVYVYQCIYQGIPVIHVPPLSCGQSDDQGDVYSCDGTILFNYGGFDGNYNLDKLDSLVNCQLLWSCQNEEINCSSGNDDPGSAGECTACDDGVDSEWYADLIADYAQCCLLFDEFNVKVKIYQCTYKGQSVIHIPPTSCNDSQGIVYDCNGNLIFWYNSGDTSNLQDLQNCTLIWSCDGDQAGCDFEVKECNIADLACDGNVDTAWVKSLVRDSLLPCGNRGPLFIYQCVYLGQTVLHIPPYLCDSINFLDVTFEPGLVYNCAGILIFKYGGFDPNHNLDKRNALQNCQLLWSSVNGEINCQSTQNDPTKNCIACDDAVDQNWYSDLLETYTNCCLQFDEFDITVEIYQCTYQGKTVIHIPPTSCNDSQGLVYDCNGNLILSYPPTDTVELQNCTLIWSCDGDQAGCDFEKKQCKIANLACNGNVDTIWMNSLQAELLSCCSTNVINVYQCTYLGQTAIHVPPLSCGQSDDQGDVYSCNGTILFNYGGIDGSYNLDKLENLENCQLLWSCQESKERCQDETPNLISTQTIILRGGWNMISTYLIPLKPAMDEIFSSLKDYIDIVKDEDGNTYIPSFGIDNIGTWDYREGYLVKLNSNIDTAHLNIKGQAISESQNSIDLTPGWNIMAYLCNQNTPVSTQFAGIRSGIILMKNNAGKQFIPSFNINNIKCLEPGQGYKVKVRKSITDFGFNCALPCNIRNPLATNLLSEFKEIHSDNNATIILPNEYASKIMAPGQILTIVNPQGNIYGQEIYQNEHIAITIWGDDTHTDFSKEGFAQDEIFSFMIIDPVNNTRHSLRLEFENKVNQYEKDNVYIAKTARIIDSGKTASQENLILFPNPTSSSCTLKIINSSLDMVQMDCIDSNGKVWKKQFEVPLLKGTNTLQLDIRSLPIGIYTIRVSGKNGTKFGKLAVIR